MERHDGYITWKGTPSPQGRPATEAESLARRRRHGPNGGIPQPVWAEVRNGMPPLRPYVWRAARTRYPTSTAPVTVQLSRDGGGQ